MFIYKEDNILFLRIPKESLNILRVTGEFIHVGIRIGCREFIGEIEVRVPGVTDVIHIY